MLSASGHRVLPFSQRVSCRIPDIQRDREQGESLQPIEKHNRASSILFTDSNAGEKGTKNVNMTRLPNAPTHWGFIKDLDGWSWTTMGC